MNKKAEVNFYFIFPLIVAVIVAFVIFSNLTKISNDDSFAVKSTCANVALEIESMLSLPFDSNIFLELNFPFAMNMKLEKNKVSLNHNEVSYSFNFFEVPDIKVDYDSFENIKSIYLVKEGDSFYASSMEPDFLLLYDCPKLKKLNNIIFDPGKGYDEASNKGTKGEIINNIPESQLTLQIASLLSNKGFSSTRKVGRDLVDSYLSTENRKQIAEDKDALISLHIGEINDSIKIYTNSLPESVALGCNVMNELIKEFKLDNTAIIPVNFDLIKDENDKQILNINKPAILIEIADSSNPLVLQKKEIADAIKRGVNRGE